MMHVDLLPGTHLSALSFIVLCDDSIHSVSDSSVSVIQSNTEYSGRGGGRRYIVFRSMGR